MQRHDCYYHFWSAMLLNAGAVGLLHGSDYSAGHRWCGSAWLNVMDGEEMVMSETVPSPARSQPLNNYHRIVWPSLNKCGDPLRTCPSIRLQPRSIGVNLDENNPKVFFWELVAPEVWSCASLEHTFTYPSIHLSIKHHFFPVRDTRT